MKEFFLITSDEVQYIAKKRIGRLLDEEELKIVQKRAQFGMEVWEEIIEYAIDSLFEEGAV